MSEADALVCAVCGRRYPWSSSRLQCECGGLLDVVIEPAVRGRKLRDAFDRRLAAPDIRRAGHSGVWRYTELVLPGPGRIVSHSEGNTPLYRRNPLSAFTGITDFRVKHEGQNPTGSFKDRGMTVAVTRAVRQGSTAFACASTGNTSASMAAYAAHAGLPALVFVPRGNVAAGKLAQALAYGARTLIVRGDFDACLRLARESAEKLGVTLLNSINPWRIEGQKTIMLELLQQLRWDPPDWIVVPAGNLGNTAAFGKALLEARRFGLVRGVPRLAAVQAAGANPFFRSFRGGFKRRFTVKADTIATAIRIGDPASYDRAVRTIRETDGVVAQVTDAEILEAKAVVDSAGIGCEPASAASVAGTRQLVRSGVIKRNAQVAAILTGHLLKDPQAVLEYHQGRARRANPPVEIAPRLAEVEKVLRALARR